jgi:ubiquinone biosynthesis protein
MTIPGDQLIEPQELAAVVPDCYAEFRPLVADGLTFFVRHLSEARLAEVLRVQADLGAEVNFFQRLVLFLHACPVLHKIGQVLARNRQLDPELRRHLQQLESLEPHTPMDLLRPVLDRELAPAKMPFRIHLADDQLAEGSVAVVVPLTWSDPSEGARAPIQHGVAKVLKPGIAARIAEDLAILDQLAGYLEERWTVHGLPPLAYRDILAEAAELLNHEVRLPLEQTRLKQAGRLFAAWADVHIPRLLPFSTDALTAMERLSGLKVTEPSALPSRQRPVLFRTIVRALISGVLLSRDPSALFHGDPHAGNLMVTHDGRLGILDWSLAGELTAQDRVQAAQILVGAWSFDVSRIAAAIAALASGANKELIQRHVQEALAKLRWYQLPGPTWVMDLLDVLVRAGVRFPPRWLLFRKAFLTLQGVVADVCPGRSLEAELMTAALTELVWEWPLRWWKPLRDCDYRTHISSADLMNLILRGPTTSVRILQDLVQQAVAG